MEIWKVKIYAAAPGTSHGRRKAHEGDIRIPGRAPEAVAKIDEIIQDMERQDPGSTDALDRIVFQRER